MLTYKILSSLQCSIRRSRLPGEPFAQRPKMSSYDKYIILYQYVEGITPLLFPVIYPPTYRQPLQARTYKYLSGPEDEAKVSRHLVPLPLIGRDCVVYFGLSARGFLAHLRGDSCGI